MYEVTVSNFWNLKSFLIPLALIFFELLLRVTRYPSKNDKRIQLKGLDLIGVQNIEFHKKLNQPFAKDLGLTCFA